ncbi:NB-ARC domain-containing protein [Kitasatospora purpeofusca]|uniref:NB-ARC domain-containing protein n=1 Tax=Kitasatospora purpeofusca TaxID=67352 RepID=UPI00099BAADB|nr:NB-ARC domain-containing protein [Kitasatospora purpeofusca]
MSSTATRLTCFALLSSIEEDLRLAILRVCEDGADDALSILGGERHEKAISRISRDIGTQSSPSPISTLVNYLDFADAFEVLSRLKSRLDEDLQTSLAKISPNFSKIIQIRNRVAHSRPMEIDDMASIYDVAKDICSSYPQLWGLTSETMHKLEREPAYVLGLKINLVADPDSAPQHNLPAPEFDETGFFGRRKELDRIKKAIKGAYPVVSILGDGGIGKTSIALKAAYELLDDPKNPFDAFVWVTAKATALTVNEIQRISGAIESSLGLFASAAEQLGGEKASQASDPIGEVLSYLEHFKVLLILDNLETVLDQRLRDFLLDLPLGSKVMITSRIGLGIENPVALSPLSDDDSTRLLHALARVREVTALKGLPASSIARMVHAMKGHPAYIRWFVAGVQAGRRPEELLHGNDLLLDFCMSNVYEYLGGEARSVLRSMQVLPGRRSQAELAFLNSYSAGKIQSSLLELMTTNFVQMQGSSFGPTSETTYQLTDFGKQYLDKRHAVQANERQWFENRSRELTSLGMTLQAESTASPYDPKTIDIQGPGDFSVARLLREALREYDQGNYDGALITCREAQLLAPNYHESWRVEAFIHLARRDNYAANAAYERAHELAPDFATLNYFYGTFLVDEAINLELGLKLLQKAAVTEDVPPAVIIQIVWTHIQLGDFPSAVASASHALSIRPTIADGEVALTMGCRAGFYGAKNFLDGFQTGAAVELIEAVVEIADIAKVEMIAAEASDRLVQLIEISDSLSRKLDEDFLAASCDGFSSRLRDRIRAADVGFLERRTGSVKAVKQDKMFGFIESWGRDYFFHLNDLCSASDWQYLAEGVTVAFTPDEENLRGPRAADLRWLG